MRHHQQIFLKESLLSVNGVFCIRNNFFAYKTTIIVQTENRKACYFVEVPPISERRSTLTLRQHFSKTIVVSTQLVIVIVRIV